MPDTFSQLAKEIKGKNPPVDTPVAFVRYAVVQSVQATSITIRFAGSTVDITNVKAIGTLPTTGVTVLCLQYGNDIVTLGPLT